MQIKLKLFLGALLCSFSEAFSQDILIKNDGEEIQVKVEKIGISTIEYRKQSNPEGPIYVIDKKDVFMLKYKNGTKDVFNKKEETKDENNVPLERHTVDGFVKKDADAMNDQLISKYNDNHRLIKKTKKTNKLSNKCLAIIGISPKSVISNEDIELSFIRLHSNGRFCHCNYKAELYNKTEHTIYVDLGNSFRISDDGTYSSYYSVDQKTISNGSGKGLGISLGTITGMFGIGGINIGKSHSVLTTYGTQRVISIPPHARKSLSECRWDFSHGDGDKISDAEDFSHIKIQEQIEVCDGEMRMFEEEESPWHRQYIITYSTSENFNTYSTLNAHLYIKDVVGGLYVPYEYHFLDRTWSKYKKIFSDLDDYTIISSIKIK